MEYFDVDIDIDDNDHLNGDKEEAEESNSNINKKKKTIKKKEKRWHWVLKDGSKDRPSTNGTWFSINHDIKIKDGFIFKANDTAF